jgi:hypothetical protein
VTTLDRLSKAAVALSVLLIIALQMALHPDMTWLLRALTSFALIFGWLSGRMAGQRSHTMWLIIAPLAPAILLAVAGREGPVVELVWIAGLTGAMLRTISWSKWSIPDGWKPLVGGWALTVCLVWPIIVVREAGFTFDGLFDAGKLVSYYGQVTAQQAIGWTLHVALTQLLGLLWLDLLCGLFRRHPEQTPPVVHGLWIGATLASVVALYQGAVDLSFLNTATWVAQRRATGTLLDANAYGMCAVLAGPIAFIAMRGVRLKQGTTIATIILIVNVIGMWMSGSRTALLAGVAGMVAVGVASWSTSHKVTRRVLPLTAAAVAVLAAVGLFAGRAIGPVGRLFDAPVGATSRLMELWTRGGYGTAALMMIREHPFAGIGLGAFHVFVPDYRVFVGQTLPFDNAQNWWRHQAAELGILGGTMLFAWSGVLIWKVLFGRTAPRQEFTARAVRGLLVALGLCSLLGMPTQSPLVLLWFMLLVAWLTVAITDADVPALYRTGLVVCSLAAILSVAYAAAQLVLARGDLSVPARARAIERPLVTGSYGPESGPSGEFQWTRDVANFYWPVKGRYLLLRLAAPHPDIAQQPVQLTLSTPCAGILDLQLRSTDPVTVGLQLPPGQSMVHWTVRVSRTFKPSAFGTVEDTRRLGATVAAEFTGSADRYREQQHTAVLSACLL